MALLISLIAAMGRGRVIGLDNAIPWRLPADMRRFRQMTMGKPVLMGRKTHQSIGKPLPGRDNLILTRDPEFRADGCSIVNSIEEVIAACRDVPEVMVIGGAACYELALPLAMQMYLTYIDQMFAGDQFFPLFCEADWQIVSRDEHVQDDKNPYRYTYVDLVRRADLAL